ncbi:hypothetical protein [Turicibacter sanguinis]|uniref:hypothetical protein n=1 Tax=Turicibacter sanguinis TaxID=154288 RepID=UPI0006C2D50B|nr:hypothetical protein [Turicibacter sanguinis]CUN12288.1 Uncharacterised protein [Turicibacter sanguinis]
MIKFSEISDCAYVFYGDRLVCKEEILDELEEYRGGEFFTAITKEVGFGLEDAKDMLKELADDLYCNRELYEDWDDEFMKQTTNEDLEQIVKVIKGIIKRVPTCYEAGEEIEFDI